MRKFFVIILILAVAFLFLIPESAISQYKGLLKIKYALKDTAVKAKDIITSFLVTGEKPKELNILEQQAKQKAEEAAKNAAKDAIKGAVQGL